MHPMHFDLLSYIDKRNPFYHICAGAEIASHFLPVFTRHKLNSSPRLFVSKTIGFAEKKNEIINT